MSPLLDGPIGIIEQYDLDGDGMLDVFGGLGIAVLDADALVLPLTAPSNNGHPGDFDGDGTTDVIYATSTGGALTVVSDVLGVATLTSATAASAIAFDVADYDADGLDDVLLLVDFGLVEVWRSEGAGMFSLGFSFAAESQIGTLAFGHHGAERAVFTGGGGSNRIVAYVPELNTAELVDEFEILDPFRILEFEVSTRGGHALLVNSWFSQLSTYSAISVARLEKGDWNIFSHELGGAFPEDAQPIDVDDDGDTDLVVLVSAPGRDRVEILCFDESATYVLCAEFDLDEPMRGVGVAQRSGLIILSNDHLTVATDLPATTCG